MTKHANIATGLATHPDAWIKAWKFAADAHREQKVKGSDLPYLFHVGAVMMELLAAHNALPIEDIDLAVMCAALHDCMEDQGFQSRSCNGSSARERQQASKHSRNARRFPSKKR